MNIRIFVLFLILLFNIEANTLQLTQQEKQYLKNHPVVFAHNEANWPPFNFTENEKAAGYSIDYINLLASKIGIRVKFISGYTWSQYMKMLQTEELDLIINISKNKERSKTIEFTDVFLSVKNAIYVKIKHKQFNTLEQLKGYTIAMPKDFYAQKFIEKNYPEIKQVLVDDQLSALKLLALGKVDAIIGKRVVMDYIMQQNHIQNLFATKYIDKQSLISHMRIGASKQDKILIEILKKAQVVVTQKEKQDLNFKWLGINNSDLSIHEKINYSLIIKIVVSFLTIIAIILFIYQKQKKLKNKIERLNKKLEFKVKKEIELNKQKDETIFKQAKLVSMGEMVSNISHQWRQPLAEVNSVVMNLEKDYDNNKMDKESLENNLNKIEELTEYMSNTIDNFNNFFKSNKEKSNLFVSEHINKVLNLFENSFRKANIDIDINIHTDISIEVYEGELSQVLIILLQNAKDVFVLNNISIRFVYIDVNSDNNQLFISIKDNAGGIKEEILEKIFEPYFTTKSETQGIGLGLYLSKQIIEKSMKGKLEVSSIDDTTTFTIVLPL